MMAVLIQRVMKYSISFFLKISGKVYDESLNELVFLYGAGLNKERFLKWNMKFIFVELAVAPNYTIAFNVPCEFYKKGFASLMLNKGEPSVEGVVYQFSRTSLLLLDVLEWVPFSFYKRRQIQVVTKNGRKLSVWAYFAAKPREGLVPSDGYLSAIIKSAEQLVFSKPYLAFLKNQKVSERFSLDYSFSLLTCDNRFFASSLKWIYYPLAYLTQLIAEILP